MRDLADFTILAVDDEPIILNIIEDHLTPLSVRIIFATDAEKALKLVDEEQPDLILLDINLPGMSGLEACEQIKSQEDYANLPIIFLTSSSDDTAKAFAAGGVDYIVKPVDKGALQARVKTHLRLSSTLKALDETNALLKNANENLEKKIAERIRDLVSANTNLRKEINERRNLQDKVTFLAQHDFVTRMYNRFALEEILSRKLASTAVSIKTGFICLIDLDQFKVLNDTCGYIAGDELLRQMADVIRSYSDNDDITARIGGDEFALYFTRPDLGFAIEKVKALKTALENYVFEWMGEKYSHFVSMGLVEIDESIDSASHLMSVAERTCYQSKLKGGGEISVYNVTRVHVDKTHKQTRIVNIIRQALDDSRLVIHLQPIVDNHDGSIKRAEVLSRLKDVAGKLQPPCYFIPVAEKFNFIDEIDRHVLQESIKLLGRLNTDIQLSINVSGQFIVSDGSAYFIQQLLEQYQVKPEQLCLEVTECSAVSNSNATAKFIARLQPLGCQFAIDDFGAGTASYEYLKKLGISNLKINGIFVRDVENDKVNQRMIESIVNVAKANNIEVTAVCVETKAAKKLVGELKIDYIQGFALHHPQSVDSFAKLLQMSPS